MRLLTGLKLFFMYGRVMSHYSKDCGLDFSVLQKMAHKDTQVCACDGRVAQVGRRTQSDPMSMTQVLLHKL